MTNSPWTPADEAAFLTTTNRHIEELRAARDAMRPKPKPLLAPTPEDVAPKPARDRYSAIRGYLTVAKERNGELPAETYLLGQLCLIMMDIGAEIAGLRDDVQRSNAYLDEWIVQRNAK